MTAGNKTTRTVVLKACIKVLPFLALPSTGLYLMLKGAILLPGDSVLISDIGSQPADRSNPGSTLVCVTTNVNTACCRNNDNNGRTSATAGSVGEWFYPNGTLVPRSNSYVNNFARVGYSHQVRLARVVLRPTPPLGVYTCEVPEASTGVLHNASITIHEGWSVIDILCVV